MELTKWCRTHLFIIVAVSLFGLAVCLTFFLRADPIGWGKYSLNALWSNSQDPELMELDHVLKSASMDNRTVILTTLNEAWARPNSILDIFLESFRIGEQTQPLLKHLVIIAVDEKAMNRCRSLNLHCHLLIIDGVNLPGSEKRFMTKEYLAWMWERTHFLGKVLELGYSFVLTDVDILWLRTPFPHFSPEDDFTIACDQFNGYAHDISNNINGGYIFVRSNTKTIKFYKHWYEVRSQYPGQHEQAVFNIIKRGEFVKNLGMKMRFLDTVIFGGFCQHGQDLNRLCTLHANCCVGLQRKIDDLNMVLDVWRNFTSLPDDKKAMGVPWRAPVKCRM